MATGQNLVEKCPTKPSGSLCQIGENFFTLTLQLPMKIYAITPIRSRVFLRSQIAASLLLGLLSILLGYWYGNLGLSLILASGAPSVVERAMLCYVRPEADSSTLPKMRWVELPVQVKLLRIGSIALLLSGALALALSGS